MNKVSYIFCLFLCRKAEKYTDLSAIFCLDRKREKRYHKPQVNHYCDEEEEYLRSICRELSVGVRQRCETEKGTLEQCHKRGLMRRHQSTRVEPRKILRAFVPCRRGKGRELFLRKTISHAEAVMCLHIGQHLFGECIDMSNGACVRSYEWGGCGSFEEAEQPVLRLLSSFGV